MKMSWFEVLPFGIEPTYSTKTRTFTSNNTSLS